MDNTKAVILAAGQNLRFRQPTPKTLARLVTGETLLEHISKNLKRYFRPQDITIVVGFCRELIVEHVPEFKHLVNTEFASTNSSRSLLLALRELRGYDVLWTDADTIVDHRVYERLLHWNGSCMAVHDVPYDDEQMNFRTDTQSRVVDISPTLTDPEGEEVGVLKYAATDLDRFITLLEGLDPTKIQEPAIVQHIREGLEFQAIDVTDLYAMEIDFPEDLEACNRMLKDYGMA